jgi:hypothetical protein
MKTLQTLIEKLKDLVAEATQNRGSYHDMRLIPIPVRTQDSKLPNQHNH